MFFKLMSTVLLVSAVLADRRHAHRRLQSLKRADDASRLISAGAYFAKLDNYTYATATFVVPAITGPDGAGIAINIALNIGCPVSELAGIMLGAIKGSHGKMAYEAYLQGPGHEAATFDIEQGDKLKFFVDGTTGDLHVKNLSKGTEPLHASFDHAHMCGGQASVMVSQLPGNKEPLGHFGTLTFEDVVIASSSGSHPLHEAKRASNSKDLTVSFDNDRTFTVHQT